MAQEQKSATVNATVVASIHIRGKKYFIFLFPRSGNEAKRARNALSIRRKVGNESLVMGTTEVF